MSAAAPSVSWLPATLTGRVLAIIFAGLTVALVTSFAFFEWERELSYERFVAAEMGSRIVDYARSTTSTAPREFGRSRLRWQDVETVGNAPVGSEEPPSGLTRELRRVLTENFGEDPVVWIASRTVPRPEPRDRSRDREGEGALRPFGGAGSRAETRPVSPPAPFFPKSGSYTVKQITVALRLPDKRQALAESLVFRSSVTMPPIEAWLSVALIFIVTGGFSVWAVRLAVRPVRMLSGAAERLTRNIHEPPLPENGATEIREAARAFNRMQERLRRHVNSRSLAFAAMSHDVRTPITRMRLRLESLGDEARSKLGRDLGEIEELTKAALELVRGIAPAEELAPVDVSALVERVREDRAALGQALRVEGRAASVGARPVALRRAIENLVDNAFKYATDVAITLADDGDDVVIGVTDRGPGIPPEHLEHVVDPFYRVEPSRNRGTGGAGLGLAIAKDVVEGHGGSLTLANREGGGLSATIRIPR